MSAEVGGLHPWCMRWKPPGPPKRKSG